MIRHITTGTAFLLWTSMLCSQAQATHIQYVEFADVTSVSIGKDDTLTRTFNLLTDEMHLREITTHYQPDPTTTPEIDSSWFDGSYNSANDLHYVTLRIDPNNYVPQGAPSHTYLKLEINDIEITDWSNPINLYDWKQPITTTTLDVNGNETTINNFGIGGTYGYQIEVKLTGLNTLDTLATKTIPIDNINIEGCFEAAAPVPEPATMLLFGSGLAGLAGWRRKKAHHASRN